MALVAVRNFRRNPGTGKSLSFVRWLQMHRLHSVLSLILVLSLQNAALAESKPAKEKLANMVEHVVAETGININVSEMTTTSVNINKVNGKDVCSPEAEKEVKALQTAFIAHPNIYRSYSIYLISITQPDGSHTQSSYASLKSQGVFKNDCINIYASVRPE